MNSSLRRSPQRATTRNNTTTPTLIVAKVHSRSGLPPPTPQVILRGLAFFNHLRML